MTLSCPYCNQAYEFEESDLGKTFVCTNCNQKFIAQVPVNNFEEPNINISINNTINSGSAKTKKEKKPYVFVFPANKSKERYLKLLLLGGSFGIHNFYIERPGKALIEILFTLLSILSPSPGVFALIILILLIRDLRDLYTVLEPSLKTLWLHAPLIFLNVLLTILVFRLLTTSVFNLFI